MMDELEGLEFVRAFRATDGASFEVEARKCVSGQGTRYRLAKRRNDRDQ